MKGNESPRKEGKEEGAGKGMREGRKKERRKEETLMGKIHEQSTHTNTPQFRFSVT